MTSANSEDRRDEEVFLDPLLPREERFPYALMRRFGVTPQSTAAQVQDASFELAGEDLADPELNLAWERLRVPRRRLLVDFFCYQLPRQVPESKQEVAVRAEPLLLPWSFLKRLAGTPLPQRHRAQSRAAERPALPSNLGGKLYPWALSRLQPGQEGGNDSGP